MEYAQRIGARIARLRTEKHLTQGQLAQAAGVPRERPPGPFDCLSAMTETARLRPIENTSSTLSRFA